MLLLAVLAQIHRYLCTGQWFCIYKSKRKQSIYVATANTGHIGTYCLKDMHPWKVLHFRTNYKFHYKCKTIPFGIALCLVSERRENYPVTLLGR